MNNNGYAKVAIQFSPLRTLDALRPHLGIAEVNTGKTFTVGGPSGIVFSDVEGLHLITDEHGRTVLRSGVEMSVHMYRGQTQVYSPCVPTLARAKHLPEQLLALCRHAAFEEVIGSHPFVNHCSKIPLFDAPLHIDKKGLAQHYGLSTDLIDVTSNFDVASFFATCYMDERGKYLPLKSSLKPGVIYRLTTVSLGHLPNQPEFHYVGWQPLTRPEQQRAAALRIKKGQDFQSTDGVEKISFKHCSKVSTRIWKAFDEGRALFPPDAAAELAEKAKRLTEFTREQINQAWLELDAWHGQKSDAAIRQAAELSSGLKEVQAAQLNWDGLNVERDPTRLENQYNEVLSRVRVRMTRHL